MRLIDAEKVVHEYYKNPSYQQLCKVLNEAPTVKAITVEWIEKWFSQFYGEQGLEWNRCKRFMLEDWEKENEQGFQNK